MKSNIYHNCKRYAKINNYYKLLFIFGFVSFSLNSFSQNLYYWSDNRKILLSENKSSVIINLFEIKPDLQFFKTISSPKIKEIIIDSIDNCLIIKYDTIQNKSLNDIIGNIGIPFKKIKSASFSLKTDEGAEMWLTNQLVLKFKQGYGLQSIKDIMNQYSVSFNKTSYDMVLLEVSEITNVLTVSNQIYESGFVEWCHPDFISIPTKFDDPLYPYQYYLNNTGQFSGQSDIDINAPEAWLISKGCSDIIVAVVDQGVEEHEELAGRVLSGYTAGVPSGIGAPILPGDGHGECCAGIIAASHNDIGIKGIAPNVKILPINIFSTNLTSEIASAIDWAWQNGADVISNSWGYDYCSAAWDDISNAITNARMYGRNGKGSIVVFAAGNNSEDCVTFPANVPGVIAVGAIDKSGQLWDYSAHGNRLDVVAPSGACNLEGDIYTIDRIGNDGCNPSETVGDLSNTNYTSKMGGTSAACPEVSGVAALMLSVNPDLTEQEATYIIKKSVTDIGKNGKDYSFGFGLIDASRALFESVIFNNPSCQFTEGYLNLTCTDNNKKVVFIESPKTGIPAGAYFAAEYVADATVDFSTPFIWYTGQGLSGANPNNGNFFLLKNDNGSGIYLKTWFYYIWYDVYGNYIGQWVPSNPNNSTAKRYIAAPPGNLTLKNIIVSIGEQKNYQAIYDISVAGEGSSFIVQGNGTNGGSSIMKAGNSITLKSGFQAKEGCFFKAYIEPNCFTNSNLCTTGQKMLPNKESENFVYAYIDTNEIFNFEEKKIINKNLIVENELTIYPNPNNGLFSIILNNNENKINDIEIYNSMGDQVLTKKYQNSNIINLNISTLNPGFYYVIVYCNNKTYSSLIIYE